MKKQFKIFFAVLIFTFAAINIAIATEENPVNMLQSLADQMIDGLKSNKLILKSDPKKSYALAYKLVVPHADIAEMSKRVLPPKIWHKATSTQRSTFEIEFTKLLVKTYSSALSDYTNQTVKFYPVRGGYKGKSTVSVSSQILRSDGPPVRISYNLVSTSSQWKLYDMSVEGISLLESFRSQFASKLAAGNIDSLIGDLKRHNASR
ncbi:ABC transporter substrate-binding protein [Gammaproteobacteria bacterium]|nr:ABC transporter substrate-binding protein [Gammaproteobacteria bacterium]